VQLWEGKKGVVRAKGKWILLKKEKPSNRNGARDGLTLLCLSGHPPNHPQPRKKERKKENRGKDGQAHARPVVSEYRFAG